MAAEELGEAVEAFLAEVEVAEKAADIFREASPDIQQVVMEQGSLRACNNPSGALISRVNKFGGKGSASGPRGPPSNKLFGGAGPSKGHGLGKGQGFGKHGGFAEPAWNEPFGGPKGWGKFKAAAWDEFCAWSGGWADDDWSGPPPMKRPRLEHPMHSGKGGKGSPHPEPDGEYTHGDLEVKDAVENFIAAIPDVAEKAANILREQAPEVQLAVIERGDFEGCSNPSGALIGRINKNNGNATRGGGGGGGGKGGGAWNGDAMGGSPIGSMGWGPQGPPVGSMASMSGWSSPPKGKGKKAFFGDGFNQFPSGGGFSSHGLGEREVMGMVEDFLQANEVSPKAAGILREQSPDVQMVVLERGALHGASNPSGALIGRINNATGKGAERGGGKSNGKAW